MSSEPLQPDAEQPVDAARLYALATEIRSLPTRGDSEAERSESAGRLLIRAINAGAFGAPEYVSFLELVRQRREQESEKVSGWISAWAEARWWLTGKPKASPRLDATFEEDCERVAKLVLEAANRRRTAIAGVNVPTGGGYTVGDLRGKTGLKNTAINKYAKCAGVVTPKRGGKDHRYSAADARAILKEIIENATEEPLRAKCREALRQGV